MADKHKILIVEDDKYIINFISMSLKKEDYDYVIAKTCGEANALFYANRPDMIILDLGLPDGDGIEIIKNVREISKIPIIVVSARQEEEEKIQALDLGADDYVTKPFPISVFRKKVSALLARIQKQTGGDCYSDGTLSINFSELTATFAGEPIIFTPMEYRLLKVLVGNPQIVLTRQALLEKLWDADEKFVDEHALTAAISRIRGKIEIDGLQYIKTVYGMGYMWIGGLKK